jgi:hypothetical protein
MSEFLIMRYGYLLLLITLTGCGVVAGPDRMATLAAENQGYVTEAAHIRGTLEAQETAVLSTSIAAETAVAAQNRVNATILETVRAGDPPTVAVVARIDRSGAAGATPDPATFGETPGGTVVDTYVSTAVRDADGCGVDQQTTFPAGTTRLYAVQRVQNIPANTLFSIEWFHKGATAFTDDLVVTNNEADLCVWFYLEPYSQGAWAVQFSSNGVPVGRRVEFTVGE